MSMYAESLRHYLKPVIEYIDDPVVTEIMINGPEDIWIEKKGRVIKTKAKFTIEGVEAAARNMAQYVGRMLDDERPRLDARLPDGSRIHVVMPPIARKGCTIAIRKFFPDKLTVDKLVEFGSMTTYMARFIEACVNVKENIVVSGGTGSGKTTLLNCVAQYIPDDERILTIEDSAELQLNQEHLVPFESRPADKFGKGKVDMGDLLHSALRLRPDRIVVGEVRGGEAFHLMQAMNTGHGGSLSTVHANTPTDTLRRLESLCLQSGIELPMVAVRAQVASAINIIIVCDRLQDGQRKTTHISEVLPLNDKGDYRTQDLFVFTPTHKDSEGRVHGYHAPTGLLPTFLSRMAAYGFEDVDERFFDPETYRVEPPPVFTASEGYQAKWAPSLAHREKGSPDPVRPKRPSQSPDSRGGPEQPQIKAAHKTKSPESSSPAHESDRLKASATRRPQNAGSARIEAFSGDTDEESTDPGLVDPLSAGKKSGKNIPSSASASRSSGALRTGDSPAFQFKSRPSKLSSPGAESGTAAKDPAPFDEIPKPPKPEKKERSPERIKDNIPASGEMPKNKPDPVPDPDDDELAAIEAAIREAEEKSRRKAESIEAFHDRPGSRTDHERPRSQGSAASPMQGRPRNQAPGRRRKGGVIGRSDD